MSSKKIRELFSDFFKQKGHVIVPSSSLISDDPSVLFTTAGMQQFKPYYLGEKSPYGNNAVSVQKCFRTSDIDSVGDESHLTFFEMLGNFSFGGYFKDEAIKYAYEFITKELGLKIDYVSVFAGDKERDIPPDEESEKIWRKIDGSIKIEKAGKKDNFWGPTGEEGPCGPTTEIYMKGIEVWNIVFNEFYCDKDKKLTKLKTRGVDTGMGLERLTMVVQNKKTIFETDLFQPLITKINDLAPDLDSESTRIFCDHLRAISFLTADGLKPSNKEAGYVLRRLWRRLLAYQIKHNLSSDFSFKIIKLIPINNPQKTIDILEEEKQKFQETIKKGLGELNKIFENKLKGLRGTIMEGVNKPELTLQEITLFAEEAFNLYQTYGLTIDIFKDFAKERGFLFDEEKFNQSIEEREKKHQEISRAGLEKKFGGHGLKEGGEIAATTEQEQQKIVQLHTATHLLHQALTDLFGENIKQMGSDINSERLRFDFPFERKLTQEEIAKLENIVNQKIKESLPVEFEEKMKEEAIAEGAKAFFKVKYPDRVKVYSIGNWSKEICNGPHVKNTSEIGKFKILKEESVGAGIRRVKATIEGQNLY